MAKKNKRVEPVYIYTSERIRLLRIRFEFSQAHLAHLVGKSRTSITNIEKCRQRVTLRDVQKIAWALGVTPEYLLKDCL